MGVDERNHPFAPGLPPGRQAPSLPGFPESVPAVGGSVRPRVPGCVATPCRAALVQVVSRVGGGGGRLGADRPPPRLQIFFFSSLLLSSLALSDTQVYEP